MHRLRSDLCALKFLPTDGVDGPEVGILALTDFLVTCLSDAPDNP